MKEATGELNMTIVTLVAISAICIFPPCNISIKAYYIIICLKLPYIIK